MHRSLSMCAALLGVALIAFVLGRSTSPARRSYPEPSLREVEAAAGLDRLVGPFDFAASPTTLRQALRKIAQQASLNLYVDWVELERSGIDDQASTTVRADVPIPAASALDLVLVNASPDLRLGYGIDEHGAIRVSTLQDIESTLLVLRFYDIRPLLNAMIVQKRVPISDPRSWEGGESSRFGWGTRTTAESALRAEYADALIRLIEDYVFPDTWTDNGGNVGRIREIEGRLVVIHTHKGQIAISELLTRLQTEYSRDTPPHESR